MERKQQPSPLEQPASAAPSSVSPSSPTSDSHRYLFRITDPACVTDLGGLVLLWRTCGMWPVLDRGPCAFYASWLLPPLLWSVPCVCLRYFSDYIAHNNKCGDWSSRSLDSPLTLVWMAPLLLAMTVLAVWFQGLLPRWSFRYSAAVRTHHTPWSSSSAVASRTDSVPFAIAPSPSSKSEPLLLSASVNVGVGDDDRVGSAAAGAETIADGLRASALLDDSQFVYSGTLTETLQMTSVRIVRPFASWYWRLVLAGAVASSVGFNGIGAHLANLGTTLSVCSLYPLTLVFTYFHLVFYGFVLSTLLVVPVYCLSTVLVAYTAWAKERLVAHFDSIRATGAPPSCSLDFVLRERYKLELFIQRTCASLQYVLGPCLVVFLIVGGVMAYRAVELRQSFPFVWILIGDMVVAVLLLLVMAVLASGDRLLESLRQFRARFPCEGERDWRREYRSVRDDIDSLIAHIAATPLGFTIFGVRVTFDTVKLVVTALVSLASTFITAFNNLPA